MSRIDEMIAKLCPDGVEYKKLRELCRIEKGRTPIQKAIPGEYPLVVTAEKRSSSAEYQFDGEAVCIPLVSSAGHGRATLKAVHYQSGKFALGNILAAVLPNESEVLSAEFLYHYLMAKKDILLVPLMRGGANVSIPVDRIGYVRVPVPPLDIQREVVRLLDVFVELGSELEAELEARMAQYAHYRYELLSRESLEAMAGLNVAEHPLGELAVIGTGSHDTKDGLSEGTYAFYARGVEPMRLDKWDFDETAIITAGDGAGVGKVFHYVKGKYALHQRAYRIVPNETVLSPRYFYHVMRANFYEYIMRNAVQGSVASIRRRMLDTFPVLLPPLSVQQQVVDILDRFDALTTSPADGLPAEIEARRQQYEYYRDRLLDFPRKEVA